MTSLFLKTVFFVLFVLSCGCAATQKQDVERLNLRDPRLSAEARRWLADTEDEVAIAEAGVDVAVGRLRRIEEYQTTLGDEKIFVSGKNNSADVGAIEQHLHKYVESQRLFEKAQYEIAQTALALAEARLTQVRAETAIRYDLAVYEMDPIVLEVEMLKSQIAKAQTKLEDRRALVEKNADQLWRQYVKFVQQGGVTRNFWKFRNL